MPKRRTVERARAARRAGKRASTQAGEFVREQIHEIRRGRHGARSPQQAIAIGLSEARRAGVNLPPPRKSKTKRSTRKSAEYAYEVGQGRRTPKRRPRVSRAVSKVLEKEPRSTVSRGALSRHAKAAAQRRKKAARPAPKRAVKKPSARRPASKPTARRAVSARKPAARRPAPARKPVAKTRARRPAPPRKPAARRQVAMPVAAQPISLADKLKARRAAAARKKAVAKRHARPAVRKARRPHKRRTASKTSWAFDM